VLPLWESAAPTRSWGDCEIHKGAQTKGQKTLATTLTLYPLPSLLGDLPLCDVLEREKSRSVLAWTWRSGRRRSAWDSRLSLFQRGSELGEVLDLRLVGLSQPGLSLEKYST
jgi:hypothetical protein